MPGQGSSQTGADLGLQGTSQALFPQDEGLHRDDHDDRHPASVGNSAAASRVRIYMPRAVWNGVVLAESDETVVVEGNHYFPPDAINREHFADSAKTTVCGWKGTANYYDVIADGETNPAAAWYYASPKDAASEIKDYVAFWGGVRVEA